VARHQTPTPDLEAEFVEYGRTMSDKCEATWQLLLAAQTDDPRLVAAAERGRREALETVEAMP